MNSIGERISDDELDECVGTIEDTTNHLMAIWGDDMYSDQKPPDKRIDLTKYNKWSVIGWTVIAVLLLADIVISALY